jgi:predicted amidophosphoribosyltransferase
VSGAFAEGLIQSRDDGGMVTSLLEELINVIAPTHCAGCRKWDTPLCDECASLAEQSPIASIIDDAKSPMRSVALGTYGGSLRNLILAAKHDTTRDLRDWLWRAGHSLGQGWLDHRAIVDVPTGNKPLHLIPAPSRWTRAWRGMLITPTIAAGAAQAIHDAGIPVVVVPALHQKWGSSQAGLSGDQRRQSRNRTITALIEVEEANCVLVDDVVTTGATMLACRDALETAGGRCFVGLSLAIVQNERSLK